jgi:hypothetical protein
MITLFWLWAFGMIAVFGVSIVIILTGHQSFETALITPNQFGGWSIQYSDERGLRGPLGSYATPEDAARVARINNYVPVIQEGAR